MDRIGLLTKDLRTATGAHAVRLASELYEVLAFGGLVDHASFCQIAELFAEKKELRRLPFDLKWEAQRLETGEAFLLLVYPDEKIGHVARVLLRPARVGTRTSTDPECAAVKALIPDALAALEAALRVHSCALPPSMEKLDVFLTGRSWERGSRIEGASLGLSVCMAIMSAWLGRPGRDDTAASAEVTIEGKLDAVEGLKDKLTALEECWPNVRRVVVASKQKQCAGMEHFEIVPAADLWDALAALGLTPELPVPPPDAGLERQSPPVALPATSSLVHGYASLPVDLGSVWGLDRGCFVGIVSGASADRVHANLVFVERALWDALQGAALALPTRWWIRINPFTFPNGPSTTADVWAAVNDPADPLPQYLRQNGLPADVVPGVVLEVDVETAAAGCRTTAHWCKALFEKIFPDQALAVVIDLSGATGDAIRATQLRLQHELEARKLGVVVERLELWQSDVPVANGQPDGSGLNNSFDSIATSGRSLHAWVAGLLRVQAELIDEALKSSELGRLVEPLHQRFGDQPAPQPLSAARVVNDLDQILAGGASEADRQLLELTARGWPQHVPNLLRAYAGSLRPAARRLSLLFAANADASLVDERLDAWVAGLPNEAGLATQLRADATAGAVSDALVLALLRRHRRSTLLHLREAIEGLQGVLSPEVRAVSKLCLGETPVEEFLAHAAGDIYASVYRAGQEIRPRRTVLESDGLEYASDLWWLLAAQAPDCEELREILGLRPQLRAVFGLCRPDELEKIRADPAAERRILDCRRDRPLAVRSGIRE